MFTKNIVLKSILLSLGGFVVTPFTFAEIFDPAVDGLIRNGFVAQTCKQLI